MMKKTMMALAIASLFGTTTVFAQTAAPAAAATPVATPAVAPVATPAPVAAPAAAPAVVTVETVAPAVVETAAPAVVETAPAVVTVEVVRDLNTPVQKAAPVAEETCKTGRQCIQQAYHAFMEKNGFPEEGQDAKGKSFHFGSAPVNVPRTHADYAKYLSMAYTQAYMNAVKQFASTLGVQVQNEIVSKFFLQTGDNARDFPVDQKGRTDTEALWLKISKYSQARLDKGLRELGIDPTQYDAVAPDQKKKLFEDALANKTIERMSLALGGINVAGNFIHEGASDAHVGVVIAYSRNIEGIAQSLRQGKRPAIQAVGQPLSVQIPNDPKLLSDMYGPHLMVDENGPVIVAYSFWGVTKGVPAMQDRLHQAAQEQARSEARAQLARFLTLSYSANNERIQEMAQTQMLTKSGKTGDVTEAVTTALDEIVNDRAVAQAQAHLQGVRTIREWEMVTESGQTLVGSVMAYSFAGIEAARAITEGPRAADPATNAPQQPANLSTSTREGGIKNALDQF